MIAPVNPETANILFPPQFEGPEHLASILIVTFNHRKYIEACISSIQSQDFPHEIIVVDNCSSDGTVDYLRDIFPDVLIIESPINRGYGAGNNLGASFAKGDVLVILNPDTIAEKDWLKELVGPVYSNSHIITTPKILTYDGARINTCGNINHFTGLTFTRGYNANPSDYSRVENVSGISGACFAIRRSDFLDLGGFDEDFFLYMEDSDLSWRAHLLDFKIIYIPTSIVFHDYFLKLNPEKLYHLEKGRYLILRKYLRWKEVFLCLPSFTLAEILTVSYSLKFRQHGLKLKFKSINDGFRNRIIKTTGDYNSLFFYLCNMLPENQPTFGKVDQFWKKLINYLFNINYNIVLNHFLMNTANCQDKDNHGKTR